MTSLVVLENDLYTAEQEQKSVDNALIRAGNDPAADTNRVAGLVSRKTILTTIIRDLKAQIEEEKHRLQELYEKEAQNAIEAQNSFNKFIDAYRPAFLNISNFIDAPLEIQAAHKQAQEEYLDATKAAVNDIVNHNDNFKNKLTNAEQVRTINSFDSGVMEHAQCQEAGIKLYNDKMPEFALDALKKNSGKNNIDDILGKKADGSNYTIEDVYELYKKAEKDPDNKDFENYLKSLNSENAKLVVNSLSDAEKYRIDLMAADIANAKLDTEYGIRGEVVTKTLIEELKKSEKYKGREITDEILQKEFGKTKEELQEYFTVSGDAVATQMQQLKKGIYNDKGKKISEIGAEGSKALDAATKRTDEIVKIIDADLEKNIGEKGRQSAGEFKEKANAEHEKRFSKIRNDAGLAIADDKKQMDGSEVATEMGTPGNDDKAPKPKKKFFSAVAGEGVTVETVTEGVGGGAGGSSGGTEEGKKPGEPEKTANEEMDKLKGPELTPSSPEKATAANEAEASGAGIATSKTATVLTPQDPNTAKAYGDASQATPDYAGAVADARAKTQAGLDNLNAIAESGKLEPQSSAHGQASDGLIMDIVKQVFASFNISGEHAEKNPLGLSGNNAYVANGEAVKDRKDEQNRDFINSTTKLG